VIPAAPPHIKRLREVRSAPGVGSKNCSNVSDETCKSFEMLWNYYSNALNTFGSGLMLCSPSCRSYSSRTALRNMAQFECNLYHSLSLILAILHPSTFSQALYRRTACILLGQHFVFERESLVFLRVTPQSVTQLQLLHLHKKPRTPVARLSREAAILSAHTLV
jgi:hypothetical protein